MISIGVLCWNLPEGTRGFFESVRRNSAGHDVEILAIDNGSTDDGNTWAEVQAADWAERNAENENLSKGYNRLFGKALERGADLVCLANNDVLVGPGWLDPIVREMKPHRYLIPNESLPSCHSVDRDTVELRKKIGPGVVSGCKGTCLFFSPEAVRIFLPIPEELVLWYCDSWIHYHLGKAGYRCEVVLDSLIFHYGSVSFYKRTGYPAIVAKDRETYNRLTGDHL